jgi:hypothetical protein
MKQPTSRQQRYVRDRKARVILTDRDDAILLDTFLLKAVRRDHVERLHFTSLPRCNDRLLALYNAGYLDRYASPYGSTGPILYCLGKAARGRVRAACSERGYGFTDEEFARQCKRSKSGILAHTLAVADAYVAFQRGLTASGPLQLVRFLPEIVVRQEFEIRLTGAGNREAGTFRQVTVAPDGCFVFRDAGAGAVHAAFAEIDRGDAGAQILSKLRGYMHFASSIGPEVVGTGRIAVLFVTTGPGRADHLRRLAERAGCLSAHFTTFDEMARFGADAAIWRVPGAEGRVGLIDALRMKGDR